MTLHEKINEIDERIDKIITIQKFLLKELGYKIDWRTSKIIKIEENE